MFTRILLGITICAISFGCFATAQRSDVIVIDNKEFLLNTNPLELHLKEINWKPPKEAAIWSSNWRGYVATWKIGSGNLILSDASIELHSDSPNNQKRKSILKQLFPDTKEVVANWYTGALIVPDGEMTNYVHMGYGSTYEAYQIIRINKGVVVEHLRMSGEKFSSYKDRKFKVFKKSEKFKKEFKNLTSGEYDWSEDEAIGFMQSYYAEFYLSK